MFCYSGADTDSPGFAIASHHAVAYTQLDDCDHVACADIAFLKLRFFPKMRPRPPTRSHRRGHVDFPLHIDDNPYRRQSHTMVQSGDLDRKPADE